MTMLNWNGHMIRGLPQMANMKWLRIFAGVLILLLGRNGWAVENERKTVSVLTLEDYPPYCLLTSDVKIRLALPPGKDTSNFIGFSWDVLRECYHLMGYTIILTVSPWARSMHYVETGFGDILFPTGNNAERLKIFHYSEEPINQANFVVYVRQDNPIVWDGLKSFLMMSSGFCNAEDDIKHPPITSGRRHRRISIIG